MARRRPDLLVVVLDCVRADVFPGISSDPPPTPFLTSLLPSSVVWTRAVTVAPWTRPSHASLFSGRYPWEHGCHTKGRPSLPVELPHIASELRRGGYHTIGLSANPQLAPHSGLARGFERMAWGRWGERVRLRRAWDRPVHESRGDTAPPAGPSGGLRSRVAYLQAVEEHRNVWIVDLARRAALGIRGENRAPHVGRLAPWVEPTLSRFLTEAPTDRPVFGFINLLDAHEPYLTDPHEGLSLRQWWSVVGIPQDHFGYLAGRHAINPAHCRRLRDRFRRQVTLLDERLREIVTEWGHRRDADNLLLVVTSDHGQAFGEHGAMFHSVSPDEAHLRIPLLVRSPGGEGGGVRSSDRASLLDIYPTLRAAGQLPPDPGASGQPLDPARTRPGLVLAATDGLPPGFPFDSFVSAPRRAELDRTYGVAYRGDWKVVSESREERPKAYDVSVDPEETVDRWAQEEPRLAPLAEAARTAARAMMSATRPPGAESVRQRLATWGYYQ
jgi:arylsulfatase A-like enzyme